MEDELFQRCTACNGTGSTLQSGRTRSGLVIVRGHECPCCERGFEPAGASLINELAKRLRSNGRSRELRARKRGGQ